MAMARAKAMAAMAGTVSVRMGGGGRKKARVGESGGTPGQGGGDVGGECYRRWRWRWRAMAAKAGTVSV